MAIIVSVQLWSARTGQKTELARMMVHNVGGTGNKRDYDGETYKGRSTEALTKAMKTNSVTRRGEVRGHPAEAVHVWNLIAKMLKAMGYG